MADRIDPIFVRSQIELLRATHPQIWDDGDERLLADMLEGETDFHRFLTVVVRRMVEAEAFIEGTGDLIAALKARCDRFEQRADAMRALAFRLMNWAEVRKVELPIATLSIRSGQQKVIITDEARLPSDCIHIRTEPDKVRIKDRLTHGETIAGAELSNREESLAVRIK